MLFSIFVYFSDQIGSRQNYGHDCILSTLKGNRYMCLRVRLIWKVTTVRISNTTHRYKISVQTRTHFQISRCDPNELAHFHSYFYCEKILLCEKIHSYFMSEKYKTIICVKNTQLFYVWKIYNYYMCENTRIAMTGIQHVAVWAWISLGARIETSIPFPAKLYGI